MRGFLRLGVVLGAVFGLTAIGFLGFAWWSHILSRADAGYHSAESLDGTRRVLFPPELTKDHIAKLFPQLENLPETPRGYEIVYNPKWETHPAFLFEKPEYKRTQEAAENDRDEYLAVGTLLLLIAAGGFAACVGLGWIVSGFFN